jgi:hypothetical protein
MHSDSITSPRRLLLYAGVDACSSGDHNDSSSSSPSLVAALSVEEDCTVAELSQPGAYLMFELLRSRRSGRGFVRLICNSRVVANGFLQLPRMRGWRRPEAVWRPLRPFLGGRFD